MLLNKVLSAGCILIFGFCAIAVTDAQQLPKQRKISLLNVPCLNNEDDIVTAIQDFLAREAREKQLADGALETTASVYTIQHTSCSNTEEKEKEVIVHEFDLAFYFVDCTECDSDSSFLTDASSNTLQNAPNEITYANFWRDYFEGPPNYTIGLYSKVANTFDFFRSSGVAASFGPNSNNIRLEYKIYNEPSNKVTSLTIWQPNDCGGRTYGIDSQIYSSDDNDGLGTDGSSLTSQIIKPIVEGGSFMVRLPVIIDVDTAKITNESESVWLYDETKDVATLKFCLRLDQKLPMIGSESISFDETVITLILDMKEGIDGAEVTFSS